MQGRFTLTLCSGWLVACAVASMAGASLAAAEALTLVFNGEGSAAEPALLDSLGEDLFDALAPAYFQGDVLPEARAYLATLPSDAKKKPLSLVDVDNGRLVAGDAERFLWQDQALHSYRVHLPAAVESGKALPVVLVLHGGLRNAAAAKATFGFDNLADASSFIAVYPDGSSSLEAKSAASPGHERRLYWNYGDDATWSRRDDVAFLRSVVADLGQRTAVDFSRIYAVGFGAGAMMAQRLACEAADLVAAVASVAGTLEVAECRPERSVPILLVHGSNDALVPIAGDGVLGFGSLQQTVDSWLSINRCDARSLRQASVAEAADGSAVDVDVYSSCATRGEVRLVTIQGGGHTWPGLAEQFPDVLGEKALNRQSYDAQRNLLGVTSQALKAEKLAWDFFKRFGP